jgi:hypothetical protein
MAEERDEIWHDFKDGVNMTRSELVKWLDTEQSHEVGDAKDGGESTGHQSGRRIAEILDTKKADLTDNDYSHMQKVNGYLSRHLAQRPSGDVTETRWRYSLMNWGHDPVK